MYMEKQKEILKQISTNKISTLISAVNGAVEEDSQGTINAAKH